MIRLAVRVRRAEAEIVLAELLELAPGGVEEVDVSADEVEYAVYGSPGELPDLPDLQAAAGAALVEVRTDEIADDWAERWRQFHRPLILGERLTVRPPWEPPGATAIDLVIEPARAFGTGAHATTRLCLQLMLQLEPSGSFLDLGCGSGVLAIAAGKLGWDPVLALDYDVASVAATAANAELNGVDLEVRRHDVRRAAAPYAETVMANLLGPLLRGWARDCAETGPPAGQLVASGLLEHEANGIADAFAACGLRERDRRVSGGWAALVLTG